MYARLVGLVVVLLLSATGCSASEDAAAAGGDPAEVVRSTTPTQVHVAAPAGAGGLSATVAGRNVQVPEDCSDCGLALERRAQDVEVELTWVVDGELVRRVLTLPARAPLEDPRTLTVVRGSVGDELTLETVQLGEGQDAQAEADRLRSMPGVVAVQVDQPVAGQSADGASPDDGTAGGLWYLGALQPDRLPSTGELAVAVLDTGVNDRLAGLRDVVQEGRNVTEPGTGHSVPAFHGTAMASLVHAMAPTAPIVPYDLYGRDGVATTGDLAAGIIRAVDDGHRILLISQTAQCLGEAGDQVCPPLDAVEVAVAHATARGALLLVAAGNNAGTCGDDRTTWPAAFADTVAVGASNVAGGLWECSNTSVQPDLVAPGQDIRVTTHEGAFLIDSGTSMSTALLAGVVSAIWSADPSLTADDLRALLRLEGAPFDPTPYLDMAAIPDRLVIGMQPGVRDGTDLDVHAQDVVLFSGSAPYTVLTRSDVDGTWVGRGAMRVDTSGVLCESGNAEDRYELALMLPFEMRLDGFPAGVLTIELLEPSYIAHHPLDCDIAPGERSDGPAFAWDPDAYDPDDVQGWQLEAQFRVMAPFTFAVDFGDRYGTARVRDPYALNWLFDSFDASERAKADALHAEHWGPVSRTVPWASEKVITDELRDRLLHSPGGAYDHECC